MGQVPSGLKPILKGFCERLGRVIRVDVLVLFGSQAQGEFHPERDVDLLVVSPDFEGRDLVERYGLVRPQWTADLPVDILPYTPAEFASLRREITLVRVAMKEGAVIS